MSWYCAHATLYVKFKNARQDGYPVWENIYLVNARTADDALAEAARVAKANEGDSNGTFTWDGRPAAFVFAGIRKVVSVSHSGPGDNLASGDELTYSQLSVPDEESLRRLARGEPVSVDYAS